MRGVDHSPDPVFWGGFITALALLAGVILLADVVTWIAAHPQPEATIEWLMTPRFSVLDILQFAGFSFALWVMIQIPRVMPRPP